VAIFAPAATDGPIGFASSASSSQMNRKSSGGRPAIHDSRMMLPFSSRRVKQPCAGVALSMSPRAYNYVK
jgi:hypothetical protein